VLDAVEHIGPSFISGKASFGAYDIVEYLNDLLWRCSPHHSRGIHLFERMDDIVVMKRDIRPSNG
jgi:hypothetical protein